MYRFFAQSWNCDNLSLPGMEPFTCSDDGRYGNAEVFTALGMLGEVKDKDGNVIVQGLTPEETRRVTLADLMDMSNPNKQTMAMMQAFPNLMNFSKAAFGYEHYLVSSVFAGTPADADGNGIIDADAPFQFDMLGAVNAGLDQFKGFNVPMFLPADYNWYPKVGLPATCCIDETTRRQLHEAVPYHAAHAEGPHAHTGGDGSKSSSWSATTRPFPMASPWVGTASRQIPKRTPSAARAQVAAMVVPIATVREACSITSYPSPTRCWSMSSRWAHKRKCLSGAGFTIKRRQSPSWV